MAVVLAVNVPAGEMVSHVAVAQFCSLTTTEAVTELAAVTVRVCEAGRLPPGVALKVNPELLKVNGPALVPPFTIKTTG